jgi:hypothetical protein
VRIAEQLRRFEAARARLRSCVDTLDKELAAIERRWREEEIDEVQMKARARRARRSAAAEIEAAVREARDAHALGVELTQDMRAKSRGTNRAREQVRRLLDSGQVAGALLDRAIELDDTATRSPRSPSSSPPATARSPGSRPGRSARRRGRRSS